MPILHRLACFRDDVVFCVFLYQRCVPSMLSIEPATEYVQLDIPD
jgi:hypothetical protein